MLERAESAYQQTRPRPTQCRSPVLVASITDDPGEARIRLGLAEVRCNCWRCEGCGRRLRQLHTRLISAAYPHQAGRGATVARFLTVTWPTDTGALIHRREDCAHTSATFARFVQEIRRTHAPRLEYYQVKEPTKRGRLHVHALTFGPYLRKCRRNLPGGCVLGCPAPCPNPCHRAGGCQAAPGRPACVQAIAHRLGLGWVDVRRVRGERHAAAYMAKYLGKTHIGHAWPRHSRRASYSRDFAPTTIGRLGDEWSARAYEAGVAAGHINPADRPPAEHTRWRLFSDVVPHRGPPGFWLTPPASLVDPATGEILERPNIELSEAAVIRRHNRRMAEAMTTLGDDPDLDPATRRLLAAAAHRIAQEPRN